MIHSTHSWILAAVVLVLFLVHSSLLPTVLYWLGATLVSITGAPFPVHALPYPADISRESAADARCPCYSPQIQDYQSVPQYSHLIQDYQSVSWEHFLFLCPQIKAILSRVL